MRCIFSARYVGSKRHAHAPSSSEGAVPGECMFLCNLTGTSSALVSSFLMQIAEHSLLLEFAGSDPTLEPFALLSHYDVVPADANVWKHHPFSGTIENGYTLRFIGHA